MSGRRDPQFALRLDAGQPDPADVWHDGATLDYLGGSLRLLLGTEQHDAVRCGDTLSLPLPPQASPRQIQDRAEAWLREEATRLLQQLIEQKFLERRAAAAGSRAPRLALSFAARGHWVEAQAPDTLRCNWRLIQQPLPAIEQAIERGIASLPPQQAGFDLFGMPTVTG
jgi:predicted metal-dependent hydrolase